MKEKRIDRLFVLFFFLRIINTVIMIIICMYVYVCQKEAQKLDALLEKEKEGEEEKTNPNHVSFYTCIDPAINKCECVHTATMTFNTKLFQFQSCRNINDHFNANTHTHSN